MRLFIAEKPSLAKAIAANLGSGKSCDGYISLNNGKDIVSWCYGHILSLYNPEDYSEDLKYWNLDTLPIIPDVWKLKVNNDAKKQFGVLKKLISSADEIIHAGDPDREGQLLVDEVLSYVGCKKTVKRILLNALDDKSIKYALDHLKNNTEFVNLRNSALARSRADWIVGMNLTRAYTKKLEAHSLGVFSFGRVQTPTMSLVVRREKEIESFTSCDYFKLMVIWKHNNGFISSVWKMKEDQEGLDADGRLLDKSQAISLEEKIKGCSGIIKDIKVSDKKEAAPLPFSLSALQIAAGKKFKYTPQQVLDTMQNLYEKKLTSYPRSDCDYLPENQLSDAAAILSNIRLLKINDVSEYVPDADVNIRSRAWNDKKVTAHHAIIPTSEKADFDSFSDIEKNLYSMICLNYIAQFYPDYRYDSTSMTIEACDETFIANGKTITDYGWKKLYINDADDKTDDDENRQTLPKANINDTVQSSLSDIKNLQTKPPARYTPASLLKAMKEIWKYVKDKELKAVLKDCSGIGTEATRASIIETLQKRGYVNLNKNQFTPTDKAYILFNALPEIYVYPDSTALWENKLSEILNGTYSVDSFVYTQQEAVKNLLDDIKKQAVSDPANSVKCPECGSILIRRKGAKGFFWGCKGYPNCRFTVPDKDGSPDFESKKESTAFPCPICKNGKLRLVKYQQGSFWGCSNSDCKATFRNVKNKPFMVECPGCKSSYLKYCKGPKGFFWACYNPECKILYYDNKGCPDIKSKNSNVENLLKLIRILEKG